MKPSEPATQNNISSDRQFYQRHASERDRRTYIQHSRKYLVSHLPDEMRTSGELMVRFMPGSFTTTPVLLNTTSTLIGVLVHTVVLGQGAEPRVNRVPPTVAYSTVEFVAVLRITE